MYTVTHYTQGSEVKMFSYSFNMRLRILCIAGYSPYYVLCYKEVYTHWIIYLHANSIYPEVVNLKKLTTI